MAIPENERSIAGEVLRQTAGISAPDPVRPIEQMMASTSRHLNALIDLNARADNVICRLFSAGEHAGSRSFRDNIKEGEPTAPVDSMPEIRQIIENQARIDEQLNILVQQIEALEAI